MPAYMSNMCSRRIWASILIFWSGSQGQWWIESRTRNDLPTEQVPGDLLGWQIACTFASYHLQ
jgi:hypothetical protein